MNCLQNIKKILKKLGRYKGTRYILNSSLAQEIFLDETKIARITPLYKSGDKENVRKIGLYLFIRT